MYSIVHEKIDCMEVLLEHQADESIKDKVIILFILLIY